MPSITIKISYPSDCNNFYSKVFFPLERDSAFFCSLQLLQRMIFKPQHHFVALLNLYFMLLMFFCRQNGEFFEGKAESLISDIENEIYWIY